MEKSTPPRINDAIASSPTEPTGNGAVLFKLVIFSILIAVVPIATYFLTLKTVWMVPHSTGSTTWAAISAVIAANIVLIGYVVIAFREDEEDRKKARDALKKGKGKKSQ